ncbi:MAG TPA: diguanylate cyclase [Gammaproteobacteria bacterium]
MKRLSRQILEQMLSACSDGIAVAEASTPEFPVVFANAEYATISDCEIDAILGEPLSLVRDENLSSKDRERLNDALNAGESFESRIESSSGGGHGGERFVRIVPLRTRSGRVSHFMVVQSRRDTEPREISSVEVGVLQREISRARQKLASLNRVDPATGVMRYEFFRETAGRDFRVARRAQRLAAVILLEIVDLDAYRDTFGQKAAESCVRMVAAQVNSLLRRASDLCARADDRTLVAMTQGQDAEEVRRLAQRIVENIRRLGLHNPRGRNGRYIDVEIGVAANVPDGAFTLDSALSSAREDLASGSVVQNSLYGSSA